MKILKKILKLNTNNKFFTYTNNLIPILIATKITNPDVTNANTLVGKRVPIKIIRDGQEKILLVTVGKLNS